MTLGSGTYLKGISSWRRETEKDESTRGRETARVRGENIERE